MTTTHGPGVHYPDGITRGPHPGALADCPATRCVQRRAAAAESAQAAEKGLAALGGTIREALARRDAARRAAAYREAADLASTEGDRLYDDMGHAAASAAWGVSDLLRARADEIAPTPEEPTP